MIASSAKQTPGDVASSANSLSRYQGAAVTRWLWLAPPLLAFIAYWPVLQLGFISDDFTLLDASRGRGLDLSLFIPSPASFIYRPVGALLTWHLGWLLWGLNPFPYHLISLCLHAGLALCLGLWLAEVSNRRMLGVVGGVVFAVYPLHLEAVGWLAAQWDAWAAFFGVLGLWLFALWWRRRISDGRASAFLLAVAVLCFGLAVFSKESTLLFLPLFPLSACAITPRWRRNDVLRLILSLIPFCVALALNLTLRFIGWGNLSGPSSASVLTLENMWLRFPAYVHVMLAPLNAELFGVGLQQAVLYLVGLGLLIGLFWRGKREWRLIILALAWVLLGLGPVLTVAGVDTASLADNRLAYLPSAGFCVLLALLLYPSRRRAKLGSATLLGLGAVALLASIGVAWLQQQPWQEASAQVKALDAELGRLIPVQPRPNGQIWYVAADNSLGPYKGAHVLGLGVGAMRTALENDPVWLRYKWAPDVAPLTERAEDAFALQFGFDAASARYHVDYLRGITAGATAPETEQGGSDLRVWDFQNCSTKTTGWQVTDARSSCSATGLTLQPGGDDPQLIGPELQIPAPTGAAGFIRLRVALRCIADCPANSNLAWFWRDAAGTQWRQQQSANTPLKASGQNVYWVFLSADQVAQGITRLRLDPVDNNSAIEIAWIALD